MDERTAAGWRAYAELALKSAEAELDGTERSRQRYVAALRGVALADRYARLVEARVKHFDAESTEHTDPARELPPDAGGRGFGRSPRR